MKSVADPRVLLETEWLADDGKAVGGGPWMEGQAVRLIERELTRYCQPTVNGRSFLVAGHRGAGKTTAVDIALWNVRRRFRTGGLWLRPLPVYLNGPQLMDGIGGDAVDPDQLLNKVLVAVVLGLHKAVAAEFARALRRHLAGNPAAVRAGGGPELAAQFEAELNENIGPARLRAFWQRAAALERGVLFSPAERDGRAASAMGRRGGADPQGMLELLALAGVCQAHQRVSGRIEWSEASATRDSAERESTRGLNLQGSELVRALGPLAIGSVVFGSTAVSAHANGSGGPAEAAIWGVGAALVAALALRLSTSRSKSQSRKVDRLFVPDTSTRTLDRVLPSLIDRLKGAGLAPVLVVDELDKVPKIEDRLPPLMNHLKKVAAEHAFTVALVDRALYEMLDDSERRNPTGASFSYFSHRVYVAHDPRDFLDLIRRRLAGP